MIMADAFTYILKSDAALLVFRVQPTSIVTDSESYLTLLLHQLDINAIGMSMFDGVVDQFVGTSIEHHFHVLTQPSVIAEMTETGTWHRDGQVLQRHLQAVLKQLFRHQMVGHMAQFGGRISQLFQQFGLRGITLNLQS